MRETLTRQGWIVLLGVPALFVIAYSLFLVPPVLGLPICAVKLFIHQECPGCGLCHSFAYLVHGYWRQSIDYHPLGIVIASWLIYVFMRQAALLFTGRRLPTLLTDRSRNLVVTCFIAAMIGQWLAKIILKFWV